MFPLEYTSVVTVERIPSPSTYKFNPRYIAQAEERDEIAEQEESYVEELCDLIQNYHRERARLISEIRHSRTRFNAVAYIFRLPEEIMATIFETYVADHWEQYHPLNNPARKSTAFQATPYQWIKSVLHVCGQWRRLALSTPQLWTYIAYDKLYEDWRLNFLLEHAGNFPLTLRKDGDLIEDPQRPKDIDPEDLYDWTPSGPEFCKRVLQESFTHIRTLALTTFDEGRCFDDFKASNEGGNHNGEQVLIAPLMRHLLLDLSFRRERLSALFRGIRMPYLKSLVLNEAPLELVERLSCSSLTRLDVVFKRRVLLFELLNVLKSLPALRRLEVEPIGPNMAAHGYDASLQPTVTLPSLESLHIGGTALEVTQLLNQLIFPIDTVISLCVEPFSPSLLASIMPTVLGHTAKSTKTLSLTERERYVSPHAITLWSNNNRYATMKVYFWRKSTSARTSWVTGDSGPAVLDLPQGLAPDSSWVQCNNARLLMACSPEVGALMDQLAILDTSKVLSLTLDAPLSDYEAPHGLLGRLLVFPQLKTLQFGDPMASYSDVRKFLQGLITPVETVSPVSPMSAEVNRDGSPLGIHSVDLTEDSSTRLLLPHLKTLIFTKIYFDHGDLDQPDSIDGDGIFALLRRCAQLGYKLESLKFTRGKYMWFNRTEMTPITFQDAVLKTGIADVVEM